jgi:hypothetical protein
LSNWLEMLRDRVIVRSQVGKRKLDAAFARRELDRKLHELGAMFLALVAEGRAAVPQELAVLVAEARELERRLESHHDAIVALETEAQA